MFSAGAVYRAHPGCKVAEEQPYWLGRGGLMLSPFSFQALLPPQHHDCLQRCCHNANMLGVLLPWVTVVTCRVWTSIFLPTLERDTWQVGEASYSHSIKTGFSDIHTQDDIARTIFCMTRPGQISTGHRKWPVGLQAFAACRGCPSSCVSLMKSWEQWALCWGSWLWPGTPLTS